MNPVRPSYPVVNTLPCKPRRRLTSLLANFEAGPGHASGNRRCASGGTRCSRVLAHRREAFTCKGKNPNQLD